MKKNFFTAVALFLGVLTLHAQDEPSSDMFFVMDFDKEIQVQNRLDGHYNTYESNFASEQTVYTLFDQEVFRGASGGSLRIHSKEKMGGYKGVWVHFFNLRDENPVFFDASDYTYFSFWVKGKDGGEDFEVKFADENWIKLEDSVPVGSIKNFLSNGVTQEWQEVLIPLRSIKEEDHAFQLNELGGVVFNFIPQEEGDITIYIDDMSFKKNDQVPTPLSAETVSNDTAISPPKRALWVWHTEPLILNPDNAEVLFDLCKAQNIEHIWLQVVLNFFPDGNVYGPPSEEGPDPDFRAEVRHPEKVRAFIRQAHQNGLKVHALDGYPEYAQKEYHYVPLAIVDAIIEFNKNSEPEERYYGVHFDNEPYLIIGWHSPERRERILREFLDLNVECQRRIRENSDMVFGVDIPFWWSKPKNDPTGIVTYNGERKPADFFCIDLLDNVGIMNYRDTAGGIDGMIAHGLPILEYADNKTPKAEIFMGVETFTYQPTKVWFPLGIPRATFEAALEGPEGQAKDFSYLSRIHGFRTQTFNDGTNLHVGIELPPEPTAEDEERMRKAVVEIAKRLGISAYPELKSNSKMIEGVFRDAESNLIKNAEWENPIPKNIEDTASGEEYRGFVATSIMLPKVTFANETYEEFVEQTQSAERAFMEHPSFQGIAIHFYKTLREKIEEAEAKNED